MPDAPIPPFKNHMAGLFHAFVVLLLFMLFGIIPGSICPGAFLVLLLLFFGLGRRSAMPEDDDAPPSPLPWIMLLYGMAIFLGSVLNLGFMIFIARSK